MVIIVINMMSGLSVVAYPCRQGEGDNDKVLFMTEIQASSTPNKEHCDISKIDWCGLMASPCSRINVQKNS